MFSDRSSLEKLVWESKGGQFLKTFRLSRTSKCDGFEGPWLRFWSQISKVHDGRSNTADIFLQNQGPKLASEVYGSSWFQFWVRFQKIQDSGSSVTDIFSQNLPKINFCRNNSILFTILNFAILNFLKSDSRFLKINLLP